MYRYISSESCSQFDSLPRTSLLRHSQASAVPCTALLLERLATVRDGESGGGADPHLDLESGLLRNLAALLASPSMCGEAVSEFLDLASFEWLLTRIVPKGPVSVVLAAIDLVAALASHAQLDGLALRHGAELNYRLCVIVGATSSIMGTEAASSFSSSSDSHSALSRSAQRILRRRAEHALALLDALGRRDAA